jgi:DNA-directed RNA polymerase I subunit RPA2
MTPKLQPQNMLNNLILMDSRKNFSSHQIANISLRLIGTKIKMGSPLYCAFDTAAQKFIVKKYHSLEEAIIEDVKVVGKHEDQHKITKAQIILRINRNPTIGDKFSSRHGQKGVMSVLWPQEDMPFTEDGVTPDVIINPHAFPSRMTIGMLMESLASKSGALHGFFPDATPFKFDEKHRALDYFGEQLAKAGFNYYGNETLYSGTLGVEFKADIFIGIVYYQRLRHMVNDKFQVRSAGPVHRLTRQPVKGRKRGGGIRFGEMERDGLLSYGASFLLRDRLYHCSDEDSVILRFVINDLLCRLWFVQNVVECWEHIDVKQECIKIINVDCVRVVNIWRKLEYPMYSSI